MNGAKSNQIALDQLAEMKRWQKDPVYFLQSVLGVEYLTPQQIELCESVRDNRRTASPAGHGLGKTWIAARLALWFLYSHFNSKVITTAPTWNQVENLLWRNIRLAHKNARVELGGETLKTELALDEEWFAIGISTNEATRFQGFHAPAVMIVLDEATGIDPSIWEAAEGIAIGQDDRFFAVGNPTDPASQFYEACNSPIWNVINLDGERHPNVLENRVVVPGAITKEWVTEREIEYGGRESALYRARVRGLFPELGDDMLISLADVERAQKRWRRPAGTSFVTAADVARFGTDETVFISLYGSYTADGVPIYTAGEAEFFHGKDTMETAGRLKAARTEKRAVDDSGVGGGVTDRLREQGVEVLAFNGGEKANEPDKFLNKRAESWWNMRELLRKDQLNLPPDAKLAADLTNVKYSYTSKGQIRLESKDEIKQRIKRSPDRGDALAIALAANFQSVKAPAIFCSM